MIEPNTFICGDCKDILEQLPDGFADLCLTDPPYGIGADRNLRANTQRGKALAPSKDYGKKEWDNSIPDNLLFSEISRASKNQIVWGGNYFTDFFKPSPCWLVWDKVTGNNGYADCELAWASFSSAVRYFRYQWKGFLQENMECKEERFHPTQKPVALFVWCLQKYSKPGDLIIDPFCGSGTTALACHKTGRRFICIDKEQSYIDIAKRRYAELIAQGNLFGSAPEQRQPQNSIQQSQCEINLK